MHRTTCAQLPRNSGSLHQLTVLASLLAFVLLLPGCGEDDSSSRSTEPEPTQYPTRGVVLELHAADAKPGAIVDHEEIDGFMAAMRMKMPVKDAAALEGVNVGDKIGFVLNVDTHGYWMSGIEVLPPETELLLKPARPAPDEPHDVAPSPEGHATH